MEFLERPLAITDVETTGLDRRIHEIIEIGLVVAEQKSLEILDQWSVKIKPEHLEAADSKALEVNGYNDEEWRDAVVLKDAMVVYSQRTGGAIFVAHNVTFDWGFIEEAFRKTGIPSQMDYHRLDLLTMAWIRARKNPNLTRFRLKNLCGFFGVPEEPNPHRALAGALTEFEVLKRLLTIS